MGATLQLSQENSGTTGSLQLGLRWYLGQCSLTWVGVLLWKARLCLQCELCSVAWSRNCLWAGPSYLCTGRFLYLVALVELGL